MGTLIQVFQGGPRVGVTAKAIYQQSGHLPAGDSWWDGRFEWRRWLWAGDRNEKTHTIWGKGGPGPRLEIPGEAEEVPGVFAGEAGVRSRGGRVAGDHVGKL